MVRTDTWLGSGTSVTFIPEGDLRFTSQYNASSDQYRGSTSSGFTADANGNLVKIQLHANMITAYSALIPDIYQGCTLDIYQVGVYVASYVVKYNDSDSFYVEAAQADIGTLADADDYFIIRGFGAPIPGIPLAGSGNLVSSITVTNDGAAIPYAASQALSFSGGSPSVAATGTYQLSAEKYEITCTAETGTNYDGKWLSLYTAGGTPLSLVFWFDIDDAGATVPSHGIGSPTDVEVTTINSSDGAETIATKLALIISAQTGITANASGTVITVTNDVGGHVTDSGQASTPPLTIVKMVNGGEISGTSITNAGGGYGSAPAIANVTAGTTNATFTAVLGSGSTSLLSDNWLGLVTSISPPSVDIEMKQLNLALAGSRNWTYQYKGAHTVSGVNLSLNANHGAWLYYALGACTNITGPTETTQTPTNFYTSSGSAAATHDDFYFNTSEGDASDQGPFFHRVIDGTTTFCPPLLDYAPSASHTNYVKIDHPTITSGAITDGIVYTLDESNTQTLPSFALEFAYQKGTELGSASMTDSAEEIKMARIVTGNQVNTLTLTADENMELTMSVDLSTKALVEPGANYHIMRNEYDENEFVNFGAPAGNQDTNAGFGKQQEFLTPFFFSEGSIKIWNTEYIRIQNVNLTINNTVTDKRFIGVNKKHKHAIPSQRTYEISFTGLVTDNKIFNELLNETADESTANQIELEFTKDNEEYIKLHFKNFMVTNNTWPLPEDKGPIVVEWTIQPLELVKAELKTHWIIQ